MAQQIIIEVPGTKISELEPTSSVSPEDVLPVVQGEQTKKAPLEQVADMVKAGLGSAASKNAEEFATPAQVSSVEVLSQQRDDDINERVDGVEFKVVNMANGADASFNTYAEMIAYVPPKANVSVRVNNDPDPNKNGTYTWDGSVYTKGVDYLQIANENAEQLVGGVKDELGGKIEKLGVYKQDTPPYIHAIVDKSGKVISAIDVNLEQKNLGGFTGKSLTTDSLSIKEFNSDDFVHVLVDRNGRIIQVINNELELKHVGAISAPILKAGKTEITNQGDIAYGITDKFGRVLGLWDLNGFLNTKFHPNAISNLAKSLKLAGITPRRLSDYIHIVIHGQSLSLGLGAGSIVSTASEAINALVPSAGVEDGVQSSDAQGLASLPLSSTELVPFNPALNPNQTAENPIYGTIIQLQNKLDEQGISSQVVGSASGHGGVPISYLDKTGGKPYYPIAVEQSKQYRKYASANGKSCLTQVVIFNQSETDVSNGLDANVWKAELEQLVSDYQTDIDQDIEPVFVLSQTSSHTKRWPNRSSDIAHIQLDVTHENQNIFLACASYVMPYNTDGVHMPPNSYRWLGAYYGKAIESILLHNDFKPLHPTRVYRNGRVITVDMHVPHAPMVFDETLVSNPGNYGFEVFDETNNKLTIQSISIINNSVKIVLNDEPLSIVTVKYAQGVPGANAGPTTGPRGNLRDSDPEVAKVVDTVTNQPFTLYNWCPIFSMKEGFAWEQ